MQQSVIQALQALLLPNSPSATIDYTVLLNISDRSRLKSVSALAEQYQCFSTAAPIARGLVGPTKPTAKKPQWCPGGARLQRDQGTFWNFKTEWPCGHCKKKLYLTVPNANDPSSWIQAWNGMYWTHFHKQHLIVNGKVCYQCTICWDVFGVVSKVMTGREWVVHVSEHLTTGRLQFCKNGDGDQQGLEACGKPKCKKIHNGCK